MIIAAATVVVGYVALCAVLFVFQRALLYPAPKTKGPPATAPGRPTAVYFHGNAQSAAELGWLARWFSEQGVGFVAVEYPGYGEVPGNPSEEGLYAAAEAALKSLGHDDVILVGQSLGSGVAVEMATRGWGKRLVLLSPYTSIPDAAQAAFPFVPARWLVRDQFDSASKAARVKIPTLVVHGDADEVVPHALGAKLAPMLNAELFTAMGGTHNDLWDRPEVRQRIAAFLR
jgi:pimeloyl-ACP methyl ester carboxylesterase